MAVVKAGADGKAPQGLKTGDSVLTNGGTYYITGVNADGSYNSTKVNDLTPTAGNGAAVGIDKNNYGSDVESQLQYVRDIAKNAGDSYYDPNNPAADINGIVAGTGVNIYGFDKYGNYVGGGSASGGSVSGGYAGVGGGASGVSGGLPSYQAQTGAVNSVYDAAKDSTLNALEQAYEKSKLNAEAAKAEIPAIYQQQANAAAAQAEKAKQAFNEYAAGAGLSSGAAGQATLAQGIGAQRDQTAIRTAQGNALADMELQLAQLYTDYQFGVKQALADNEYERAAALLSEYQRAAESVVATAQAQAEMDYRYYVLQMEQAALERELAAKAQQTVNPNYTGTETPSPEPVIEERNYIPFYTEAENLYRYNITNGANESQALDAVTSYLYDRYENKKIGESQMMAILAQYGI